jgi:hypothetical protein
MQDHLVALEERMGELRRSLRQALIDGDHEAADELRRVLEETGKAWEILIAAESEVGPRSARTLRAVEDPPRGPAAQMPAREQVHQVLALLEVPAAPKLISAVHEAFFGPALTSSRLTSLRRDEERSWRNAPHARAYYLCPALMAGSLSAARALLTISTWPLEQRIIGPSSTRVHYLTAALKIAQTSQRLLDTGDDLAPAALELLEGFERILRPGHDSFTGSGDMTTGLQGICQAAQEELDQLGGEDLRDRKEAAGRARTHLDEVSRLFGVSLVSVPTLRSAQ